MSLLVAAILILFLAGPATGAVILVTGNIAVSTTWTANNTYDLQQQVIVLPGATLTIEPGTIIASTTFGGGSLAVARGAQIHALGTQTDPILMTSTADVATWTMGDPTTGVWRLSANEWGNLSILGCAYISSSVAPGNVPTCNANNLAAMEGLIAAFPGDPTVLYGGGQDDDDSGVLRYVSIRYGGKALGLANELAGLALGGVGRGTDIHHVEIMNGVDDGIEIWGGTVDLKWFSVWNVGDDSLNISRGWRGKAQFGLIVQGQSLCAAQGGGIGDNVFELDGADNADWQPVTTATIYNCTVIGQPLSGDHGTDWLDNARVQFRNSIVMDLGERLVDPGVGYGGGGTLTWPATWLTAFNAVPPHPNDCGAAAYQAQSSGRLIEFTGNVFFRNLFSGGTGLMTDPAYVEAVARGVFAGGNNNVLTLGALVADEPVQSLVRGAPVFCGGLVPVVPVVGLDPRPANDALIPATPAPADGFFTAAPYRGAFAPDDSWLQSWTASDAFGFTASTSAYLDHGNSLRSDAPGGCSGLLVAHPELEGTGPTIAGALNSVNLFNARPGAIAGLFLATSSAPVPFFGGILMPNPFLPPLIVNVSANGTIPVSFPWPAGVPVGAQLWIQWAIQDPGAILGVALSNALEAIAQ